MERNRFYEKYHVGALMITKPLFLVGPMAESMVESVAAIHIRTSRSFFYVTGYVAFPALVFSPTHSL